ncbi:single-stranded-DNA-specific exonuclease RecJ [Evansella sp. AB-P1]|uniref:single-stranded-DNA-specific exonuclease RecJ n=1 Tax=Evansella sp. AB-P1 TaxID=3037653 RepID=UPI00241DBC55|nr:single-stranded-DNA-specific exonuclease RecJ [Evansella sp. AB-P1]MDG5786448.1 single-stranded-DNA-specific exonuclease RecJ [Evansella sp. AB-P1]
MLQGKARWNVSKIDESVVKSLAEKLGISMIASRFLVQRGFTDYDKAKEFLHIEPSAMHDPFLLKDMEKATNRIQAGIERGENILVFGDYDADGVTSTSLMYLTLKQLGANVGFYVPNRFTEGYGPNEQAFRHAKEEDVSIIITVDTGISAVHEANVAKELGIDLIITDHHEPPPEIPDAYAVINPKQEDCTYPNPNLAGVGVAFKVSHGLLNRCPEEYFDLVAMGTIADLVPLVGENRFLAIAGVRSLTKEQRPGVKALLEQCGITPTEMTEEQIGFMIGPRLNAAGRLDSAEPAVHLLISEDVIEALELATMIDDLNKERQKIVNDIVTEAEEEVLKKEELPPVLIIGKEGWNAGVIGIVASRLVEKFYRPTIILSYDFETGLAKGSARSINGFDLFQSLSQCREWLPHFGGHTMAAGLTMKIEHIPLLQEKLNSIAESTMSPEDWERSLSVDLPVSLSEVTIKAIQDLQCMAPFGVGNPAPKVLVEKAQISSAKKIGTKDDHLKLALKQGDSPLDGIGFRMGDLYDQLSPLANVSLVGQLSINEWNGHSKPQMVIEDIKVEEWQLFDLRGVKDITKKSNVLPTTDVAVVVFRKESEEILSMLPQDWLVVNCIDKDGVIPKHLDNKHLLFLDLPESMSQIKNVLHSGGTPLRIYVAFIHDRDYFFDMQPTREHFKWFYAFMMKRKSFDINKNGTDLGKHKGWPIDAIHFICQVFFELEFVKINNGIVTIVEQPNKKDLLDSSTYQKRMEQSDIENELLYSSLGQLKEWFSKHLKEKVPTYS